MQIGATGIDDVIHSLNKAMVLVEALSEAGVSPEQALAGSGLQPSDLANHAARMSTRQLLTICRNATRRVVDPLFAIKAGRRVHATHLGVFGFALISSATYREALTCVKNYRSLSAPLIGRDFYEDGDTKQGLLTYFDYLDLDEDLFRFVLDFQLGVTRTLVGDIFGDGFKFLRVDVTYERDAYARDRDDLLAATVAYDSGCNQVVFDSEWLDRPLPYSQLHTARMLQDLCEQMITALRPENSFAAHVAKVLIEQPGCFPGIDEVADRLHLTSRTLRRKLQVEGTSYVQILASVRKDLAIHYLRTTQMKTETIAESLGFRDVANFRQAFRKWTSKNPSDYRNRGRMGCSRATPSSGPSNVLGH